MLNYKGMSVYSDGRIIKSYQILPPYTPCHCLQALDNAEGVTMGSGRRNAEHHVGFGADADESYYSCVSDFLASGDYDYNAGDEYVSHYRFGGTAFGESFTVSFSDKGILILACRNADLDLRTMIDR